MNPSQTDSPFSQEIKVPSERAFGLLWAMVLLLIALFPMAAGGPPRLWALGIATAFALAAAAMPRALTGLNLAWYRLGMRLHRVVNPMVLGLIYFAVIAPAGWLMRRFRKDPLRLVRDPGLSSYWIVRTPKGPAPDSLKHPF